jgi:divalent metal cation (Fe/Co/Zn/Cd) transporter
MISAFIAYAGYGIIRDASDVLCDTAAVMDVRRISDIVLSVKGVKACHKIRSRGRHDDICLDLHVQVDPNMHMDDAHKICYAIEDTIRKNMQEVSDVLVHIEPKGKPRK